MGYVVASCDYRLGWNPVATTQEERVNTLINAAYRGVQDCRTAIRYFRKSEAENANPYGIDPSRICVWGQGTGGYIAFGAATINEYEDIAIPKFTIEVEVPPGSGNFQTVPMVLESVNGDIFGTSVGINPIDGDTLCYPNHTGYSSDFNVMVNMGGACGDSSWVTDEDVPMISFHAPADLFAPYNIGTVVVPGFNLPVVEVSGSYHVQEMAAGLGLNALFAGADNLGDVYTNQANTYNNGFSGLYPLNRPAGFEADSAPWEWWTADNPNNLNGLATNPDMSMTKGMTYLDTIQGYSAPRIMCALELAGSPCDPNNVVERQTSVRIYPNPSAGLFNINLSVSETIRSIEVFDLLGKRVMEVYPNTAQVVLDMSSLTNGIYTVKVKSDESNQSVRVQKM
jgi:hypothetical protein